MSQDDTPKNPSEISTNPSQDLYDREREYIKNIARDIRTLTAHSQYDHRKFIGKLWLDKKPIHADPIEISQGRLIHAIGMVLKPANVYEIGVGPGITAHSLFSACPCMHYHGLDILGDYCTPSDTEHTAAVMQTWQNLRLRGDAILTKANSDDIPEFKHCRGSIDLIHVDGDHSFAHQRRDVEKAIRSEAEWLLVDDANDTEVVCAVFEAWKHEWNKSWRGGLLPFIYFEDSRTGSILFHSGMWKRV